LPFAHTDAALCAYLGPRTRHKRNRVDAISAAQVIPALPGALLGVPLGIGLFAGRQPCGTRGHAAGLVAGRRRAGNPGWVATLASLPARVGARRPPGEILQAERA
jgi:putative ABC transport system permease protein